MLQRQTNIKDLNLEDEIWYPLENFPYYQISNYCRFKSLERNFVDSAGKNYRRREQIVKQTLDGGYLKVKFWREGKITSFLSHRIFAEKFIPNPHNYPVVNHKNGIKTDNRIENLEWCTFRYNQLHAYANGLKEKKQGEKNGRCHTTKETVLSIREDYKNGMKPVEIKKKYSLGRSHISGIIANRTWRHLLLSEESKREKVAV